MSSIAKQLSLGQNSFRNETFETEIVFSEGGKRETEFINCVFEKAVELSYTSGKIVFDNCIFSHSDDVKLFFVDYSKIVIKTCTFSGNLILIGLEDIYILNSDVNGVIEFRNSTKEKIKVENKEAGHHIKGIWVSPIDDKKSSLEFYKLNVEELDFSNYVPNKIRLWGGKYNHINLDDARNLNNLQIWGDDHEKEFIRIQDLSLTYLNLEGDFLLKFAEVKNIDITPFTSKNGFMRWQGVTFLEGGKVRIQHSNLENVQWNGVNFKHSKLIFDWSMFSKIEMANIVWPENRVIHPNLAYRRRDFKWWISWLFQGSLHQKEEETYGIQREIYRQLKSVSVKNHNQVDALAFYKNEMRVYWSYIRLKGGEKWWDQILIWINRNVSNFGQSYVRPFILLFAVHYLLFMCLTGMPENNDLSSSEEGFRYFYLLNPAHKIPEYINTVPGYITEFLMRGSAGFFAFHFIKATRKYAKI